MSLEHFPREAFPSTSSAIAERLGDITVPNSVVLFGGTARNALLEAVSGVIQPIRDVDVAPIGNELSDEAFWAVSQALNPDDPDQNRRTFRHPTIAARMTDVDFTINEAVIEIGDALHLTATTNASEAVRKQVIQPTAGRIAMAKALQAGGEATYKQFLRNETEIPARAAAFVARFRASGINFDYNLLDHPTPASPERAHPFYIGLMLRKTLSIDELERGPGDITATRFLLELYQEIGLLGKDVPSRTVEHIISVCEAANRAKPAIKFYGSEVANKVNHTGRLPEPRTN